MASEDKAFELLLDLGPSVKRKTRTELLDRALRTGLMLMDGDAAVVATALAKGEERLVLHAGAVAPAALRLPPEGSQALRSLGQGSEPLVLASLTDDPRVVACDGCPGVEPGPVIFTPLKRHDLAPSYLAIFRRRGRARFTMSETRMMMLLGGWLATALENLRLATGAKRLAVTDEVTEVYNHRFLKTALEREIRRASRYSQPLSVVAIDIDGFESYGLSVGDTRGLLRDLAAELSERVRSFDILARQGETGFALVLPQTDREGAAEVAERMRAAVEQHTFSVAPDRATTVSLGIASLPDDGTGADDLVAASHRALEDARQEGGNRVAAARRAA